MRFLAPMKTRYYRHTHFAISRNPWRTRKALRQQREDLPDDADDVRCRVNYKKKDQKGTAAVFTFGSTMRALTMLLVVNNTDKKSDSLSSPNAGGVRDDVGKIKA